MMTLLDDLADETSEDLTELMTTEFASKVSSAEGLAARALRMMLFEHDPSRGFGDLRRVQSPSGDFLWVCTTHYTEYDPGLPSIPDPASR